MVQSYKDQIEHLQMMGELAVFNMQQDMQAVAALERYPEDIESYHNALATAIEAYFNVFDEPPSEFDSDVLMWLIPQGLRQNIRRITLSADYSCRMEIGPRPV